MDPTKLQAGRVGVMTDTLAGDMDDAMVEEWNRVKDLPLPTDQNIVDDRHILFVAIARGLLKYLERNEDLISTTEDTTNGGVGTEHSHQLSFEWE